MRSFNARRGDIVRISAPKGGAVSYVAVQGGFDIAPALGSRSTYRRAALGGYRGRPFQAGDRIPLCLASSSRAAVRLKADIRAPRPTARHARPECGVFQRQRFRNAVRLAFTVAPASDRMGLRLQGPGLDRAKGGELPSQGTTAGALQVPGDGQPILLLADRQTTGGYPRIATVTGADIAAAGRLASGMSVRFSEVGRDEAVRLLKEQQAWLASLPAALEPAGPAALSAEQLLSCNLIGGVTAGIAEE